MNDELIIDKTYVEISTYRTRVLKSCTLEGDIPTNLSKKSKVRMSHISKILKQLKDKDMIVCINEDAKKGRIYRLTQKGNEIKNILK